jgi:hypothetical protein
MAPTFKGAHVGIRNTVLGEKADFFVIPLIRNSLRYVFRRDTSSNVLAVSTASGCAENKSAMHYISHSAR